MRIDPNKLEERIIKKANQSQCRHKVVAIGVDRYGKIIGIECNKRRFWSKGGGWHAEELLMFQSPRSLSEILIARVKNDRFLPIDPCPKCRRLAHKRSVKIKRFRGET